MVSPIKITLYTDCRDMAINKGQEIMYDFTANLRAYLENEVRDYGFENVQIINLSSLLTSPSEALKTASTKRESSFLHITLKASRHSNPLKWPSRVRVITSSFDQTLVGSYFVRYFDQWLLNPMTFQTMTQLDYQSLKNGTLPLKIIVGDYFDLSDLGALQKLLPRIQRASSRALINFLYPIMYPPEPEGEPRGEGDTTRQSDRGEANAGGARPGGQAEAAEGATAAEIAYCEASQGHAGAAEEEGLRGWKIDPEVKYYEEAEVPR